MSTDRTSLAQAYEALDRNDHARALQLFADAASAGHVAGDMMLGWMHEAGLGTQKSDEKALHYYRRAAARGDSEGLYLLGRKLRELGEPGAMQLLQQAAGLGEPGACLLLGRDASLSLEERLAFLEPGARQRNVHCLLLSGRLLLRRRTVVSLAVGLGRIAAAFVLTVVFGFRHRDLKGLKEDKRLQQ